MVHLLSSRQALNIAHPLNAIPIGALPVSDMGLTAMVLGAVLLAFLAALVKAKCRENSREAA